MVCCDYPFQNKIPLICLYDGHHTLRRSRRALALEPSSELNKKGVGRVKSDGFPIRRGAVPRRLHAFFLHFLWLKYFRMLRFWTRPLRPLLTASISRRAMSQQSTPEFVSFFYQNHLVAVFWPFFGLWLWRLHSAPFSTCFRHQFFQPLRNLF